MPTSALVMLILKKEVLLKRKYTIMVYKNLNNFNCIDKTPFEIVDKIMKMNVDDLKSKEKQIIHPWPNTYTYSKNLCERALKVNRGNVPMVIVNILISNLYSLDQQLLMQLGKNLSQDG